MKELLPYNHITPPDLRRPLPVRARALPTEAPRGATRLSSVRCAIRTSNGAEIPLQLDTDSSHLLSFFTLNWPTSTASPGARILALRDAPEAYGMPAELAGSRWYCSQSRQVWMFGNEYYGNVKITVRGLCSEMASDDEMYVHGCSLAVQNRGLVLSGMSGSGKTTLTAALRRVAGDVRVVNDDWGPLSLSTGQLVFTGEPHLHMKYPSVRALAPTLELGPERYPSEDYSGDNLDPKARMLISPLEVFGARMLAPKAVLQLFVVVRRPAVTNQVPSISPTELSTIQQGQHSAFYDREEHYMNGSLFLVDQPAFDRYRSIHEVLLDRFRVITIDNTGTPERAAELILDALLGRT